MAEESHINKRFEHDGSDDMSAMRVLMHTVKGISAISAMPGFDTSEYNEA